MAFDFPQPARKLIPLLTACATEPTLLKEIVAEDFRQSDAFRLLQQLDEYEFISGTTKKRHNTLKQFPIDMIQENSIAVILLTYVQLQELMAIIEKSTQALFKAETSDIDVIHKDWNGYYERIKRCSAVAVIRSDEADILEMIRKSGETAYFVHTRKGQWNHQQWLDFKNFIRQNFGEVSDEALGRLLEEEKNQLKIS